MSDAPPPAPIRRHYFVDEAGDPTLFDFRGRSVLGKEGCSSHFILGVLDVGDPIALNSAMRNLHHQIRDDPLLRGIESLRPERQKTYRLLHAKDDIPEVRDRVFRFLADQDVKFHAEVRRKSALITEVLQRNEVDPTYQYNESAIYDSLVSRLFKKLLHKADEYSVCFSNRGARDRTAALGNALTESRRRFLTKWSVDASGAINTVLCASESEYCLQAVDYFLWAVQRAYSRGEDRFIRFLWPKVGVIHDIDDKRNSVTGVYYNKKRPLTSERIKEEPADIGPVA